MSNHLALVTGASSGIGEVYARRLAARGHDLVLVARRADRLATLAAELESAHGIKVRAVAADLTEEADLARAEAMLRDEHFELLVNNAGMGPMLGTAAMSDDGANATLALNVTALMRLTRAALPGLLARNAGAIVNVGSVMAFNTAATTSLYSATKSFVLVYSQSLAHELAGTGVHVQAVLPAGTVTDFYETAGVPISNFDPKLFMTAEAMVDAALVGLDRKEVVTIPALHDGELWTTYETARAQLFGGNGNSEPAPRYAA
jgi:uncharacterized protein